MSRHQFRSIFVSDVHLGLRDCQAHYLLDFLRSVSCERLYLVGDIIDFENMQKRPFWHASHGEIIHEILGIAENANEAEVMRAYKDAIKQYHPDRIQGQAQEQIKFYQEAASQLNQAKETMIQKIRKR